MVMRLHAKAKPSRFAAAACRGRARGWRGNDAGVSAVMGMILVLAISIVGIAVTLHWGLPAISEMKAQVEGRSGEAQFGELDADIKELAAGAARKTATRWEPSLASGSISIEPSGERWVVMLNKQSTVTCGATTCNKYNFSMTDFYDPAGS